MYIYQNSNTVTIDLNNFKMFEVVSFYIYQYIFIGCVGVAFVCCEIGIRIMEVELYLNHP